MFIDSIADLIIKIKNASIANHPTTLVKNSKMIFSILQILKDEGYIVDFEVKAKSKSTVSNILVTLKYKNQTPAITGIRQISKPGLRIYQESKKIPRVLNGLGIAIISTSQGLLTDKKARTNNLGGEVIAYVW